MSSSYVMLADVPELDRDALLKRLAKRQATAEGLSAQLRVPMWASKEQRSELYARYAFATCMQFERVPEGYWLEAGFGRAEVVFTQNAVFCGNQGYLHVRVLQQDANVSSTGMPGRPQKAKDLIDAEFQRRANANECEQTLKGEARALVDWLRTDYPLIAKPTQKTVENNIRKAWRTRAQYPTK